MISAFSLVFDDFSFPSWLSFYGKAVSHIAFLLWVILQILEQH